jgi:hypothetical protein
MGRKTNLNLKPVSNIGKKEESGSSKLKRKQEIAETEHKDAEVASKFFKINTPVNINEVLDGNA